MSQNVTLDRTVRCRAQSKRGGAHFPSIPEAAEPELSPFSPDPEVGEAPGLTRIATMETATETSTVEEWQQKVILESASTISEQVMEVTTHQLNEVWAKGKEDMQKMHQMHMYQVDAMQAQVNWFVESNQRLAEENRQLKGSMEQIMRFLGTMCQAQAQNPFMLQSMAPGSPQLTTPPPRSSPTIDDSPIKAPDTAVPPFPTWTATGASFHAFDGTASLIDKQNSPSSSCSYPSLPQTATSVLSTASQNASDMTSPLNQSHTELPASISPPRASSSDSDSTSGCLVNSLPPGLMQVGSSSDLSMASSVQIVPYSITLRRSEGCPLGLEVTKPEADDKFLVIEGVLPLSVAEAWNKQNIGNTREILPGDRIVSVNGACEPHSMRVEFMTKPLLKIGFERHEVRAGDHGPSTS